METRELATKKAKNVDFTLFDSSTPFGEVEKIVFSFDSDQIDLEEKRISALYQLHKLRSRSAWIIGDLLLKQSDILEKRYKKWQKMQEDGQIPPDEKYNQPRKIMHWVEANEDRLKFGTRQARRYVNVRNTTDKEIADKIGVKKLDIISQAPMAFQEDLKKKCADENWSADKLVNEVASIKVKLASEKEFEKKVKPNLPKINVKLDKSKSNRIILEVTAKERDLLNQILQERYLEKMKEDLYYASLN